jgi:hypothetical protein
MAGFFPAGDLSGSAIEKLHALDLVGSRNSTPVPLASAATGAELAFFRAKDSGEERLVDRLGTCPHRGILGRLTGQEPRDLLRRPPHLQLRGDRLVQRGSLLDLAALGPLPPQDGLVVRPPRLVGAVRLAVASDLPVHGLEALADLVRDDLHRRSGLQSIGDRDPIILGEEARRDGAGLGNGHPASIDEPQ